MARSARSFFLTAGLIGAGAMVGGLLGPGQSLAAAAANEDDIRNGLKQFTALYRVIEENAADRVDADRAIYRGAIPGMLRTLDPHSSFFDVRDFANLREEQRGKYYGVGMTVQNKDNRTIVIAPFTGSPAYKAGIRPGDIIMQVNDKDTEGLRTDQVADLLKGPKGTAVQVLIMREGLDKPLTFNLIRDEIPRYSVETAFFLKPGIAYIDIQSFTETTSKEVEEAVKRLGEANIKGLVLDLRQNPGGLLNEGVAVAGRFLRRGQTVVSHRGRATGEKPYTASNGSAARDYPIVVLVDRFSASAAEIVAGALQDHDRGWILGENTFGKGLVQTVFPMSENTGLALTTARYYTPSGRLIQRDYSTGSFYDYYFHKNLEQKNSQDVKMTDSGRTVYGGGGIAPDEKFTFTYNPFQLNLLRRRVFFEFMAKYFGSHSTTIARTWEPDEALLAEFHQWLLKLEITFTEAEFAENQSWLKSELKKEAFITAFSRDESLKFAAESDPMVQKALESLSKARGLLDGARKQIVQRDTRSDRH